MTEERSTRPEADRDRATAERVLEVRRPGLLPYDEGLALQEELVSRRRSGEIPDRLLLLEHPHVITLGTGADPEHLLLGEEERKRLGVQVREVGRGGDITYHGPGQLVGYPILDLNPDRKDLHRYLRDLEEVLILALSDFGVEAERIEGLTGVWVQGAKVAAIGVRVSSGWITSHGFALNVCPDLRYFRAIVPCGIGDRPVTSLSRLLERDVSVVSWRSPRNKISGFSDPGRAGGELEFSRFSNREPFDTPRSVESNQYVYPTPRLGPRPVPKGSRKSLSHGDLSAYRRVGPRANSSCLTGPGWRRIMGGAFSDAARRNDGVGHPQTDPECRPVEGDTP